MNYKITVTKESSRAWAWSVMQGQSQVAGGYCKTKRHALSDAAYWILANSPERKQILNEYQYDGSKRITSPGKFEGEPIFAPHYWNIGLEGFADSDNGNAYSFRFTNDCIDFIVWPELKAWLGSKRSMRLVEDSQGFVHCF